MSVTSGHLMLGEINRGQLMALQVTGSEVMPIEIN